ncbi:MAG: M1 family peptidase [Chitinophagaceae bacterium]|nr:MAG: M1 family peptidase [Chitinophagaceae bacterium]
MTNKNYKCLCLSVFASALATVSLTQAPKKFSIADTLRGSINPARAWWNVQRYDLDIEPDFSNKQLKGTSTIVYRVTDAAQLESMQIDLQEPLQITAVLLDKKISIAFAKSGSVWMLAMPRQAKGSDHEVAISYQGKVHEAIRAPWDGGFIFAKDSLGRPWMTVACQGLGASVWFPCKDHQSDEPDKGASLTITAPDTLVAIANGRLQFTRNNNNGTSTTRWAVVNPISTYCLIPYIGMYKKFSEVYQGEKGRLDLTYWALDYNEAKAKSYMPDQVHKMLKAFEHWFGPYPFYEDGYQLIETSHTGMEHQSAVSYGNWYKFGYRGRDMSGYGWGMKFDFIIIHESGHEWFGNNLTTKDLADMWVHEGFTNYSETLFVEDVFGVKASNEYNYGTRKGIKNDVPVIPVYGVNAQGSGDMYPKGGNMLHSIRHSMGNDEKFTQLLRGLNRTFYHQTVTSKQVEAYVSKQGGFNYQPVFDQYLRTIQVPKLEYYVGGGRVYYRYTNCVKGFNLPVVLSGSNTRIRLLPGTGWKNSAVTAAQAALLTPENIRFMYYVEPILVEKP